jgi:arylsulfatase A-like enzyme
MGKLKATGGPKAQGYASQKAIIETNRCQMFFPFKNPKYFLGAKKADNFSDLLTAAAIDFVDYGAPQPLLPAPLPLRHARADRVQARVARAICRQNQATWHPLRKRDGRLFPPAPQTATGQPKYAAELFTLDAHIGRLIDALKKATKYDNTLIILTGDNGRRATVNNHDHRPAIA